MEIPASSLKRKEEELKKQFTFRDVPGRKNKEATCVHCNFSMQWRSPKEAVRHLTKCDHFTALTSTDIDLDLKSLKTVYEYKSSGHSVTPSSLWSSRDDPKIIERIRQAQRSRDFTKNEILQIKLALIDMIADCNLPFSVVERNSVKKLLVLLNAAWEEHHPSKYEVRNKLLDLRLFEVNECIIEYFRNMDFSLTLAIDGWNTTTGSHIIGASLSTCADDKFLYENFKLPGSEDGIETAKLFERILHFFEKKVGKKIQCVITDNASQCSKARRLLTHRYPDILMHYCMAHQINLITGKASKIFGKGVVERASKLIYKLRDTRRHLGLFNSLCSELYNKSDGVALKPFCQTRWNSAYFCMTSVLRTRTALLKTCKMITEILGEECPDEFFIDESFIIECEAQARILKPLAIASLRMQRENAVFADVVVCFLELYETFSQLVIVNDAEAKRRNDEVLEHLEKRWDDLEHPLIILSCALHPVCGELFYKMAGILAAKTRMDHLVLAQYVSFYSRKFCSVSFVWADVVAEWQEWIQLFNSPLKKEFANKMCDKGWAFWDIMSTTFPILGKLAKFLLSCKVQSASCERLFSKFGLIKTKLRSRLKDEALSKMATIAHYVRSIDPDNSKSTLIKLPSPVEYDIVGQRVSNDTENVDLCSTENVESDGEEADQDGEEVEDVQEAGSFEVVLNNYLNKTFESFSPEDKDNDQDDITETCWKDLEQHLQNQTDQAILTAVGETHDFDNKPSITSASPVETLLTWRRWKIPLHTFWLIWKHARNNDGENPTTSQETTLPQNAQNSETTNKRKEGKVRGGGQRQTRGRRRK